MIRWRCTCSGVDDQVEVHTMPDWLFYQSGNKTAMHIDGILQTHTCKWLKNNLCYPQLVSTCITGVTKRATDRGTAWETKNYSVFRQMTACSIKCKMLKCTAQNAIDLLCLMDGCTPKVHI